MNTDSNEKRDKLMKMFREMRILCLIQIFIPRSTTFNPLTSFFVSRVAA